MLPPKESPPPPPLPPAPLVLTEVLPAPPVAAGAVAFSGSLPQATNKKRLQQANVRRIGPDQVSPRVEIGSQLCRGFHHLGHFLAPAPRERPQWDIIQP